MAKDPRLCARGEEYEEQQRYKKIDLSHSARRSPTECWAKVNPMNAQCTVHSAHSWFESDRGGSVTGIYTFVRHQPLRGMFVYWTIPPPPHHHPPSNLCPCRDPDLGMSWSDERQPAVEACIISCPDVCCVIRAGNYRVSTTDRAA